MSALASPSPAPQQAASSPSPAGPDGEAARAATLAREVAAAIRRRRSLDGFPDGAGAAPAHAPTDDERRLRAMLDAVPADVVALDPDLAVLEANRSPASAATPDPPAAELRAAPLARLFSHPEHGPALIAAVLEVLAETRRSDASLFEVDGATLRVGLAPLSPREGAGRPDGVVLSCVDLGDAPRARAVLEASRHLLALGRLSANVAHEFNNLLQVLVCSIENIAERPASATSAAQVAVARDAIARGSRLARQLLTFGRASARAPVVIVLPEAVNGWWPLLENTVGRARQLELRLRGEARVRVDPDELQLALVNLCINARDATRPGAMIVVEVGVGDGPLGRHGLLRVRDPGHGMTPDVLRRASEPFFTTKPRGEGTGLGLSAARAFAEAHGGALEIESEAGAGTTVTIRVPVAGAAPSSSSGAGGAATRGRALVVEDETPVAAWLAGELSHVGFETRVAGDFAAARAVFRGDPRWPDLVLLDMVLPDGSGVELLTEMSAVRPDAAYVLCTGFAEGPELQRIAASGRPLLRKPFSRKDLEAAIARAESHPGAAGGARPRVG